MKIPYVLGLVLIAGIYVHAGTPQDKTDEKVLAALQQYDKTLSSAMFSYKLANISQEKKCKSPVVFLNGKSGYCGTGGCNMFILDCTENGYKIIGNTSVAMPPVYVAATSSHGYKDIKVDLVDYSTSEHVATLTWPDVSLAPDESITLQTIQTIAPYGLRFILDPENTIEEADEENNTYDK